MKKILIISIISVIIAVGIGITTITIMRNNKANQEISKEQKEEIKILDEENEEIDSKVSNVDNEIEKLEKELQQEGVDTKAIKEKIDSLKEEKQELIVKKQENLQKQENILKQENANNNFNNTNNTVNNSNSNSVNNDLSNNTNSVNQNNSKEDQPTSENYKEQLYTINVSTNNIVLEVDEEKSFSVNFTNPKTTFTSSSIMEKNSDGIIYMDYTVINNNQYTVNVKGLKSGTTQIEITEYNTPNVKKIVNVTVKPKTPTSGISLNKSNVEITYGQNQVVAIGAHITPENAKNRNVIWKSSNEKVAKPNLYKEKDDIACTVIPVGGGTCTFTATTEEGGYSATCEVVIKTIPVTGIRMDNTIKKSGCVGDTIQLKWYIDPYNATNRKVNWTSKDPSIASVNADGFVTFHSVGMTDIIGTTADGGYSGLIVVQCTRTY